MAFTLMYLGLVTTDYYLLLFVKEKLKKIISESILGCFFKKKKVLIKNILIN